MQRLIRPAPRHPERPIHSRHTEYLARDPGNGLHVLDVQRVTQVSLVLGMRSHETRARILVHRFAQELRDGVVHSSFCTPSSTGTFVVGCRTRNSCTR